MRSLARTLGRMRSIRNAVVLLITTITRIERVGPHHAVAGRKAGMERRERCDGVTRVRCSAHAACGDGGLQCDRTAEVRPRIARRPSPLRHGAAHPSARHRTKRRFQPRLDLPRLIEWIGGNHRVDALFDGHFPRRGRQRLISERRPADAAQAGLQPHGKPGGRYLDPRSSGPLRAGGRFFSVRAIVPFTGEARHDR